MKLINNLKLREKSIIIVITSILIPMVMINMFFYWNIDREGKARSIAEMQNYSNQIEYSLKNSVREAISIADYLNRMERLNTFLKKEYKSDSDYYSAYNRFIENEIIQYYYTAQSVQDITVCTSNASIVNGTYFVKNDAVGDEEWYRGFISSGKEYMVCAFFEDGNTNDYIRKGRHLAVLRKLNYFGGDDIIKLDLDYAQLQKDITRICGSDDCRLYSKDGEIVVSSGGMDNADKPFDKADAIDKNKIFYEEDIDIYGIDLKICMSDRENTFLSIVKEKKAVLLAIYVFNLILPSVVLYLIYRSINDRLSAISENIELIKKDIYDEIVLPPSKDEFGEIIQSYNLMVKRIRELIETVFKTREREQELMIAKKQAELHALQSQINPHFLFNALESIRMHSLIKNESETAQVLEDFSILLRENIHWNSDTVSLEHECRNVQRYLELQKYRFGDRLDFSVHLQEECKDIEIPRFCIITFVENACVHGIEDSVKGGSVSVIVSRYEGVLYFEIMDSGKGMAESELDDLRKKIDNADISYLKKSDKSIGIVNTIIRLKQFYGEKLYVDINSSTGGGTEICIAVYCGETE